MRLQSLYALLFNGSREPQAESGGSEPRHDDYEGVSKAAWAEVKLSLVNYDQMPKFMWQEERFHREGLPRAIFRSTV